MAHNILSKCDRALVAYLSSVIAGTEDSTYPAKYTLDKAIPNTICHSKQWRMMTPNSGIYVVSTQILVTTDPSLDVLADPDDQRVLSDERVSATWDAFFAGVTSDSSALAAAITAAGRAVGISDFTVMSCVVEGGDAGSYAKGNAWTDGLDLEIVCCPSDVS